MGRVRSVKFLAVALSIAAVAITSAIARHQYLRVKEVQRPENELRARQAQLIALAKGVAFYLNEGKRRTLSAEHWPEQIRSYVEPKYLEHLESIAINRAVCGQELMDLSGEIGIILFFESNVGGAADVKDIPQNSPTGMFALTYLDGSGYPRAIQERHSLIAKSQAAIMRHSTLPSNQRKN